MINLEQNQITFDGESSYIARWEVWFRTMSGLHRNVHDALQAAREEEMPQEMIRPIPVAISEDGRYEECFK